MGAYHRNIKPGDRMLKGLAISYNAFLSIDLEAKKHNLSKVKMVDAMVNFWVRNYVIVEQLSLSSNNKII